MVNLAAEPILLVIRASFIPRKEELIILKVQSVSFLQRMNVRLVQLGAVCGMSVSVHARLNVLSKLNNTDLSE